MNKRTPIQKVNSARNALNNTSPPHWKEHIVLSILSLFVSCLLLSSTQACVSESHVTETSPLKELPTLPESVWYDLEKIVEANSQEPEKVLFVFSKRYLLHIASPERGLVKYETDSEEYRAQLKTLEQELQSVAFKLNGFAEKVASSLLPALEGDGQFYLKTLQVQTPYKNQRDYPDGPNNATLSLVYWPEGYGQGKKVSFSLYCIQEQETWKIDRFSPDPFEYLKAQYQG